MKKLFLLCIVAITASFVSCAEKEEGEITIDNAKLIGRWEIYKTVNIDYDYRDEITEWGESYGIREIWEFLADGTGAIIQMHIDDQGQWWTDRDPFTYSLTDGTICIHWDDDYNDDYLYYETIEKLTSNELVLVEDWGDNYINYFYFKRVI